MSVLEIIERAMNASGLDCVQTQDARDVIEALTAANYRILAPGEVDRETVERCAEVAGSLPWFIEASPAHIRGRSPAEYAAAIRTLTDGGRDA